MLNAPQPRSRLYTTNEIYFKGLKAVALGYGNQTSAIQQLEAKLAAMAPGYHAVAVPLARVGIYLALKNMIRPGQKVILSPYTITEVVNMVLCAGGIPVFADIEGNGNYNIDAAIVEKLLKTETDVGAVMVTHFFGLICNIEPILLACKKRGIPVIEDTAQAFGAKLNGKVAGGLADVGVFSFGLYKTITSFFGGAMLVRDKKLADAIRKDLAEWPTQSRKILGKKMVSGAILDTATTPWVFRFVVYWLFRYAVLYNLGFLKNRLATDSNPAPFIVLPKKYRARLSEAQAEMVLPQLDRYDVDSKERIAKAKIYNDGLANLPGISIPPYRADGSHIYWYYPLFVDDREALARYMTKRLRDIQVSHHRNCASLPCYSQFQTDCPNAEKAEHGVIYLPVYPTYKESEIAANIQTIREFCQGSR